MNRLLGPSLVVLARALKPNESSLSSLIFFATWSNIVRFHLNTPSCFLLVRISEVLQFFHINYFPLGHRHYTFPRRFCRDLILVMNLVEMRSDGSDIQEDWCHLGSHLPHIRSEVQSPGFSFLERGRGKHEVSRFPSSSTVKCQYSWAQGSIFLQSVPYLTYKSFRNMYLIPFEALPHNN